jgi:integrase/recombinase XerD
MKLTKAREGFLLFLGSDGYAKATIRLYGICLNTMITYLGDLKIHKVSEDDLRRFMYYLRTDYRPYRFTNHDKPIVPSTLDNYWTTMRTFFTWLNREYDTGRPDQTISRPKYKDPEVVPFTEDEVVTLLRAATTITRPGTNQHKGFVQSTATAKRNRALITLLLDTGIRVGELCRLEMKDLDMEARSLTVIPFETGKKSRPRTIPIGAVSHQALWKFLAEVGYELRPNDLVFNMTTSGVQSMFNRLKNRTGINKVHAHRFRHTFAIEYIRGGGDAFTLKYFLGHSTLSMVTRYIYLATGDHKAAHAKASPGDRWLRRRGR